MTIEQTRQRIEEIKAEQRRHIEAAEHPTSLWRRDVELAQVGYYEQDLARWCSWLRKLEDKEN